MRVRHDVWKSFAAALKSPRPIQNTATNDTFALVAIRYDTERKSCAKTTAKSQAAKEAYCPRTVAMIRERLESPEDAC